MSLDKSMQNLSVSDSAPALPTSAPPPPVATPPIPAAPAPAAKSEIDEALIKQQLLSAARLNNTDLLHTIIADVTDHVKLAHIINTTRDFTDNSVLHLSCKYGSYEFLDTLLDQEGVEVDPLNRENETPLFFAVNYCKEEYEHGVAIVEMLIDAGSNPSLKNKSGLKAIDLAPRADKELISVLETAQLPEEFDATAFKADIVEDVEGSEGESGSESDQD